MMFKKLLQKKKITQIELAKKLGVSQSLISQWICGLCQPQLELIPRIAEILQESIEGIVNCFQG